MSTHDQGAGVLVDADEARRVVDCDGLDRRTEIPVDALASFARKLDDQGDSFAAFEIRPRSGSCVSRATPMAALYTRKPGAIPKPGAKARPSDFVTASAAPDGALIGRFSTRRPRVDHRMSWER